MFGSVRDALWAAAFIRDFAAGERTTLFKRLGGTPRVTQEVARVPGRRDVSCVLFEPEGRTIGPRPAMVVTHGFTHEGSGDPRLVALCCRLARLGWMVMAPELPQMRRYQLGLDDSHDLETALQVLTERPDVDPSRVGLMAFSFGAAPLLIALAQEAVRARTRFALVFGGYFDLRRTLKYVLTGAFDCEGHAGVAALPARNDDRWKFLRGNVHLLPDSPSRFAYIRAVESRIADPRGAVDIDGFSAGERALWRLIENRRPEAFDRCYEAVAEHIDAWVQALSPARMADRITTPLVIVHSRTDPKTHFSESIAMSRGLPHAPPPQLAIMDAFTHVDLRINLRSIRAITREVLPGAQQLWRVGVRLVRECG